MTFLVGRGGLEPPRANAHKILSLARLPIPPPTHITKEIIYNSPEVKHLLR